MASSTLVIKDIYREYADKYGNDRTFFANNHVLMKNLLFNRRLRNKLQPLISSRFPIARGSSFDYNAAYNSLKNIDIFLRNSNAMNLLADYFYSNQPMPNEYYANPIFVRENPEDIIDINQYSEFEDENDKLSKILLFSRTAFYANKSVKFVDAVLAKNLKALGFDSSYECPNPYDYTAIDDFCTSSEFSKYLSAIMQDGNAQDRKAAKKDALKSFIESIKNNNFDKRFTKLLDGDDYTKLENFLTLWTSHQALYSIKNLATIELLKACIDWNKEAESEKQKISYNLLYNKENPSFGGISFDIPYSNINLSLHIPTVYLEKNIFPILAEENINIKSLYKEYTEPGSAVLLKSLSRLEIENVNNSFELLKKHGNFNTNYGRIVTGLKKRTDNDLEF